MMKPLPHYVIANPTGNITLLVTDPVSIDEQAAVSAELFRAEPSVEQIGFVWNIVPGISASIRMSGGEFCGNASLSAAALVLQESGRSNGEITLDFFGLQNPVSVSVEQLSGRSFRGSVSMPLPEKVSVKSLILDDELLQLPVVAFPGISHVLLNGILKRSAAEAAVIRWCEELKVPALGIMLMEDDSLTPLVFVREVNSLFWESSCASGTCAAVYHLFHETGSHVMRSFREPGGILSAEAGDGYLHLFGNVSFSDTHN